VSARRSIATLYLVCASGALVLGMLCAQGCKSPAASAAPAPDQLPSYESLATEHNARVGRFETLWARAIATVSFVDEHGDQQREQGEGNLQLVKPSSIALSIGKLGEVIAWIGTNDTDYWLLEPSAEPASAVRGTHAAFTQDTLERLGLPVNPLLIIEALGVTALPDSTDVRASFDGSISAAVYELPERARRYAFDLESRRLVRIDFLGENGELLASAKLWDELPVTLRGESGYFPRIAKRVEISDPRSSAWFRITLSEARDKEIKPRVFDPEFLLDAYRIELVTDLDQ